jgi:hypothetical protein
MKLSKFDTRTKANSGVEIELIDLATGMASDASITVLGTDSDVFKRANAERARVAVERIRARGKAEVDAEESEDDSYHLLAAVTVGWKGLENEDGTPLAFSKQAAFDLYKQYPLIFEQVDRGVAARTRFIKG